MSSMPNDDLIRMALSDRVTFEEIEKKLGLKEAEVVRVMKKTLRHSSYVNWRKRVKQRPFKHRKKYKFDCDHRPSEEDD